MEHTNTAEQPWYASVHFRRSVLIALCVAACVEGYYAVYKRKNDFNCHLVYGEEFLQGEPYQNVGNLYPLGRVMLDALLVLGDYHLTRAVVYSLAILSLIITFRLWEKIATSTVPLDRHKNFLAGAVSFAILFPFILRDFDECGLQILMLLMLSLGAYAFFQGRKLTSGFCVAAAVTYKATPLLFLPFLLWKREWKTAGALVVFTAVLNLVPATYLGWDQTMISLNHWYEHVTTNVQDVAEAYPSIHNIDPPKHLNVSLSAGLARLLETYPPDHELYIDHPLFLQFGNMSPKNASTTIRILILALGLVFAWKMRRAWPAQAPNSITAAEWSVACIFSVLLSPLCWKQHLVLLLPAIYLCVHSLVSRVQFPKRLPTYALVGVAVVFLLTRRFLLGKELAEVLLSYNFITLASVVLAFLVLHVARKETDALAEKADEKMSPAITPKLAA